MEYYLMNELSQYYLNWKLQNQDKYSNIFLDKNTIFNISLDEFIIGHEDSTKYKIEIDLSNFKPGFVSLLTDEELLNAESLIFENVKSDIYISNIIWTLIKQLYKIYLTYKTAKITKLYIHDILINNETNAPIAIVIFKVNDGTYTICPTSFVYLLFLTTIYKDILVVSE